MHGTGKEFFKNFLSKFLIFLGGLLAILFSIAFVLSSTIALTSYNLGNQLLNSGLYKKALRNINAYDSIPSVANSLLDVYGSDASLHGSTLMPPFLENLPAANRQSVLAEILPATDTQRIVESALDQFFAFIHSDVDHISLSISDIKANYTEATTDFALSSLISSLPPCGENEIAGIVAGSTYGNTSACNPPSELLDNYISLVRLESETFRKNIPAEVVLSLPSSAATACPIKEFPCDGLISNIRLIPVIIRWLPLLPVLFLLGIAILKIRSLKSMLIWWGIPVFFSGLLCLLLGLAIRSIAPFILDALIGFLKNILLTNDLEHLVRQLGEYLFQHSTEWIIYEAVGLLVLGLAAWITSAFFHDKRAANRRQDGLQ
ncbi:MAG: hypothetical protein ABSG01_15765 [Anaerolineales bacterium]